ncbi:hypothetical protein AB2L57_09345 [Microbacterium sp. HA-8]|uniref:hypothetical protein n=1 Tax=Microbacterium sp. HA-8 TaxID=3234200 RepID=UPI0038F81186
MSIALLFSSQLLSLVDGVPAWYRFHGDTDTRVFDDESLVLSITDGDTSGAAEVITQWSVANGFSLEGISPELALTGLLWSTVLVAVKDAPDYEAIHDAMQTRKPGASPLVPDFRLIIGGGYVVARLIEIFDRPGTDEENRAAFDRRTGGRYS